MFNTKNWFYGQVKIEITGWGSDRLMYLCKRNDINIYNLKIIDHGYCFLVSTKDYKKIIYYNSKIESNIVVNDKTGLPNFFYKYKKRKIFALCLILCFLGTFIFSNYIWNISIIGNQIYTKEELIEIVKNDYVSLGHKKNKINCNKLEKQLRGRFNNIAWISCEIKGTNLIIYINETIPNDILLKSSGPCNIIAYKDAIITEIITSKGKKLVSNGDQVKKDDILITGVVNISNEYDELIETNYIEAEGIVMGIVEYNYNDQFPINTTKKVYTGRTKNQIDINFINNQISLPSKNNYNSYDTISYTKKLSLFDNFYIPLGYTTNVYKEYTISNIKYTPKEAYEKANQKLILYIENLKKKGVSILENNVKITIVNDVCIASGIIKCKEVIGIPAEIEKIQQGEQ